jgi:hypothetical protein
MLKNQRLIFFLIPSAIAIWGVIIYRIYSQVSQSYVVEQSDKAIFPVAEAVPNSFNDTSLNLNYPDPFIRSFSTKSSSIHKTSSANFSKHDLGIKSPQIKLKYLGFIKNHQSKTVNYMLGYDNKTVILTTGKISSGFSLVHSYQDSILVKYKNNFYIANKDGSKLHLNR